MPKASEYIIFYFQFYSAVKFTVFSVFAFVLLYLITYKVLHFVVLSEYYNNKNNKQITNNILLFHILKKIMGPNVMNSENDPEVKNY